MHRTHSRGPFCHHANRQRARPQCSDQSLALGSRSDNDYGGYAIHIRSEAFPTVVFFERTAVTAIAPPRMSAGEGTGQKLAPGRPAPSRGDGQCILAELLSLIHISEP